MKWHLTPAALIIGIGALFALPRTATAINASPNPVSLQQPDGTPIQLRIRGDEFFHWFEDAQGYTVVRDRGAYVYADQAADGTLAPTAARVGRDNPALRGLKKRVLPSKEIRRALRERALPAGPPTGQGPARSPSASGGSGSPSGAPSGVQPSGVVRNLVVLCKFSDHDNTKIRDQADYDTVFNAVGGHPTLAPTGSVRDYYTEASYGIIDLQSTVVAWVTLPHPEAYYANGTSGMEGDYPENPQGMVEDALDLVDPLVDFGQFDSDNDGFIDAITIIHSGYAAETGGGGGNWIWSHKWSLWALPGGQWTSADNNASSVPVKVFDYHTEAALWGTTGNDITRIGVICHETGHFFGLPDLYDIDGTSEGIGSYCLMANSWGFDFTQQHPPHFSAWCKEQLGWLTPTTISAGSHSLPRSQTSQSVHKITAGFPTGEYLLIENRQPFGFESNMPQGGLCVWHIDESKDDNTAEGYPGQVDWPSNGNHYKIALLQADGQYHMEKGMNRGDGGDVFHAGGVSAITPLTTPNTQRYQGGGSASTNLSITNISAAATTMTFDVSITSAPVITSAGTAAGVTAVPFSYQVTATNSPTSYSATGLPSGLSINTSSGLISGTPTAAGTFVVNLGATNASGTGVATVALNVEGTATIFDSYEGGTYTLTTSSPRTFMGLPVQFANTLGTSNIPLKGGTAYLVTTSAVSYTAIRLNISFWGGVSGATSGSTPAYSNLLGSYSFDYEPLTTEANTFYSFDFTLPAPLLVPGQNCGVTINWQGDTGSGFASADNLASLIRHTGAVSTGSLIVGGPTTFGYYRNASGETNGNFLGSSFRSFGGGLVNQALALKLTGVAPDGVAPTLSPVTIASSNANVSRAKAGDVVTVTFTSNEPIRPPSVTLAGHAATVTNLGGNQWQGSWTMNGSDAEGTVAFNIEFADISGQSGTAVSATTNGSSVIFDRTAPTVAVTPSGTLTKDAPITFTFTFSESVTGLGESGITVGNGTKGTLSGSGDTYTLPVTPTGQGAVTCQVTAGAALDFASNGNTASNNASVTFDSEAATLSPVAIASSNASSAARAKVGDDVTVIFTANEVVQTPSVTIAGRAATVSHVSGNQWQGTTTMLAGDTEGAVAFSISVTDLAGNTSPPVSATTNASSVIFDKTAPTAAVTLTGTLANSAPITFTLTFSEAVTGLSESGITVSNGTKGTLSGSGAIYTLPVTPTAQGAVTCQVNAGVALDSAANGNTASNNASVTYDTVPATLSPVSIASSNASSAARAKAGDVVTVAFTASEVVQTPSVSIAGHAASVSNVSGNQWQGSATMTGADSEGTIAFTIDVTDLAGNASTPVSATTNSSSVVFDRTPPTVAVTPSGTLANSSPITFTLTFSEPVTGLAASGITVGNGTKGTLSGIGAVYTLPVTPTAQGAVTCQVDAGAALDSAANTNFVSNNASVIYDSIAPTLSPVAVASDNTSSTTRAKVGDVITLTFTANEPIETPTATIAAQAAAVANISGNTWAATTTVASNTPEGVASLSITFRDLAGNDGAVVSASTNGSSVTVDRTAPGLTPVHIASSNAVAGYATTGDIVTLEFTASEGIQTPIVTLAGQAATVSHLTGNQWSATRTLTAAAPQGSAAINVTFMDLAGNASVATAVTDSSAVIIDNELPSFTDHPDSITVNPTDVVSFSVAATSLSPVTYLWRKDTVPMPTQTNATLNLGAVAQSHEGSYDCVVTNIVGSVTSDPAVLTVNDPEIAVEQPAGADLADAGPAISFDTIRLGSSSAPRTFIIKNLGLAPLNLSSFVKDGTHAAEFTVDTTGMDFTLAPTESTTFTVTFTPTDVGPRTATLHIPSDDADESSFDIPLAANGRAPVPGTLAIGMPLGSTILVNEEAGTVSIPIVRTGGSDFEVGLSIEAIGGVAAGQATVGSDFNPPANAHWDLGDEVTTLNVPIPILNPANTNEVNETFTVNISAPTGGASLGAVTSVTVRIIDTNDATVPAAPLITSPAAGAILSVNTGATINLTGTATDNKGVGSVKVKLNNGAFVDAVLTAQGTPSSSWSLAIVPATGANTITVQTMDTRNNPSTQVARSFSVHRPLGVVTDTSLGSVTAGFSPTSFREVGKSLVITATPKAPTTTPAFAGAIFTGWTIGGQDVANGNIPFTPQRLNLAASSLDKQTLTFVFREGLVLTANFVLSPFAPMAGTYNGLIRPSTTLPDRAPLGGAPGAEDGTTRTLATEGRFTATVQNTGAFSGTLTIDGLALSLSGVFDNNGDARFGTARVLTQTVARTGKPSYVVALHADMVTPGVNDRITGTVTLRDFKKSVVTDVSTVEGDRAYYNGTTLVVPAAYLGAANANGMFTVVFPAKAVADQPPGLSSTDYPQGDGIGTVTVTKAGAIALTGRLADGTAISASSALSQDNRFPLFAQLYNKLGFLSGFVQLDSTQAASDMSAVDLQWLRPFMSTSHYYPYGWMEVIKVDFMAARYSVVAGQSVMRTANGASLPAADADGNVSLVFSDGRLSETLTKSANLNTADMVTKVPDNDPTFTMMINRLTGAVTGTLAHTEDTVPAYNAIIYQKGPNAGAYGHFLTPQPVPITYNGESGGVTILGQ